MKNNKAGFVGGESTELYRQRLSRHEKIYAGRGLMAEEIYPLEDREKIIGVAALLSQSETPIVLRHPLYETHLEFNSKIGAATAFLYTMGDYAQRLCESIHEHIRPEDHVLVLGAGIGLSSILAYQCSNSSVMAVEADPALVETIQKNAVLNKADITVQHGCVLAGETAGQTDYYLSEDLWSSSVYARTDELEQEDRQVIRVPVLNIQSLIQKHKANTIVADIQGAEIGLFEQLKLTEISTIIIRIHTPLIGERATAGVISSMTQHGFLLKDIKGWVFTFKK